MRNILKIDVEGNTEVLDLDAVEGSLKVLQSAVGGWVEAVDLSETATLWCNEEGKIIGLERNEFGTLLTRGLLQAGDYIAGDIAITGGVDDEGDTVKLMQVSLYVIGDRLANALYNEYRHTLEELEEVTA